MRPVNLIPAEERRGEQAPLRTGPLAYIVIGALVAVLAGVTALVLTGNQISEREDELVTLKAEDAAAAVKAKKLAAYTQFRELSEQRVATVQKPRRQPLRLGTGDARTGSGAPGRRLARRTHGYRCAGRQLSGGGGGRGRQPAGAVQGPALELRGCAAGQEAVADFVTVLKDIDGVTRVGVSRPNSRTKERRRSLRGWRSRIGGRRRRLPDPQLHREVPDRRRLRRGAPAARCGVEAELAPQPKPPKRASSASDRRIGSKREESEGG